VIVVLETSQIKQQIDWREHYENVGDKMLWVW